MNYRDKKLIVLITSLMVMGLGMTVSAWSEPASGPPNNNAGIPINTGNQSQYKTGLFGATKFYAASELHSWGLSAFGETIVGTFSPQNGRIYADTLNGPEELTNLVNHNNSALRVLKHEEVLGDKTVDGVTRVEKQAAFGSTDVQGDLDVSVDFVAEQLASDDKAICVDSLGYLSVCGEGGTPIDDDTLTPSEIVGRYIASMVTYRMSAPSSGYEADAFKTSGVVIATAECEHRPSDGIYEILIGGGGSCGGQSRGDFGELNQSFPTSSGFHSIFDKGNFGHDTGQEKECSSDGPTPFTTCSDVTFYDIDFGIEHNLRGIINPWSGSPQIPWSGGDRLNGSPQSFENDNGEDFVDDLANARGFMDTWYVQCDGQGALAYAYAICLPVKLTN